MDKISLLSGRDELEGEAYQNSTGPWWLRESECQRKFLRNLVMIPVSWVGLDVGGSRFLFRKEFLDGSVNWSIGDMIFHTQDPDWLHANSGQQELY